MFNVVFFSCVGSLYNLDGDEDTATYTPRTNSTGLYNVVLDGAYDEYKYTDQSYFNIYVRGDTGSNVVRQVVNYEAVDTSGAYKIIAGAASPTAGVTDPSTVLSDLGTSAVINVTYSSIDNVIGIPRTTSAVIDLTTGTTTRAALANKVQAAIVAITDDREGGTGTAGMSGVDVYYSSNKYRISGVTTDTLYVSAVNDYGQGALLNRMGLEKSQWTDDKFWYASTGGRDAMTKGIKDLIDDLDKRSQVTIRNIYITPVIQTMDVSGTVYIGQLEDKQEMERKVNNAIYKWADQNIDFNTPVNHSNIVDIIEAFPGVTYADISIVPNLPTPSTGNWSQTDPRTDDNDILGNMNTALNEFLSAGSERNERRFYEVFVKGAYDNLADNATGLAFRDTDTFRDVIGDIRKDLLKDIKDSMFETVIAGSTTVTEAGDDKPVPNYRGNIRQKTDSVGNHVRGGYSVGYEIVKLNSELVFEYQT